MLFTHFLQPSIFTTVVNKEPTEQQLLNKQSYYEKKLIQELQNSQTNIKVKLNYETKQTLPKFHNPDNSIPQNKIEFFQDHIDTPFQSYHKTPTKWINIYLYSEDFLSQLSKHDWKNTFEEVSKVQIIIKNTLKISSFFLESLQQFLQAFQIELFPLAEYTLMYQDKSQFLLNFLYHTPQLFPLIYHKLKTSPTFLFKPNFINFQLENHTEEEINSLLSFFCSNSSKILIGQQTNKKEQELEQEQENETKTDNMYIYPESQYDNLNKILKNIEKKESLFLLSLNLQNYAKLNQENIQCIQNCLENTTNLKQISIHLNDLSQHPYLKDTLIDNFFNIFNFPLKPTPIENIDIFLGEHQFKIWQNPNYSQKTQYILMHSNSNNRSSSYPPYQNNILQQDLQNLQISSKKTTNNETSIQMKYNLEFHQYSHPNITQNQLKSLINLLKIDHNPPLFEAIQIDLRSPYIYNNPSLTEQFFNTLITQLNSLKNTQNSIGYYLTLTPENIPSPPSLSAFKQFIDTFHEKITHFHGHITISHPTYILQIQKLQQLEIKIQAAHQKKLNKIKESLQVFSSLKTLSISSSEPVSDLQMWSLFEALSATEFPNFTHFFINFYNCEQLTDEFFSDFSKFLAKKGPQIKYFSLKLSNNKQITTQGAKILSKSFRNLKNLQNLKLKFDNLKHFSFEPLSLLCKFLSGNNPESLQKFKLYSNNRGDISTINPGLQQLASNCKSLKILIIYLPKAQYQQILNPNAFFTAFLSTKTLNLLVFSIQQVLIFLKKGKQEDIFTWKQIKHYIYLAREGTETSITSSGSLVCTYLQSLKDFIGKIKFKLITTRFSLDEGKKLGKYTENLQYIWQYVTPEGYIYLQKIFWNKIWPGLSQLQRLEYLVLKDCYSKKQMSKVEISQGFQEEFLAKVPRNRLIKLKIVSNFYVFTLHQQNEFVNLFQRQKRISLKFQESIYEGIQQSRVDSWYGDTIQVRQLDVLVQTQKNFSFFFREFGNDIAIVTLDLKSKKYYSQLFHQIDSFLAQIQQQQSSQQQSSSQQSQQQQQQLQVSRLNKVQFLLPQFYYFEKDYYDVRLKLIQISFQYQKIKNLQIPEFEMDIFDTTGNFFYVTLEKTKQIRKQKEEQTKNSVIIIQTIKKTLKLNNKQLLQDIMNYCNNNN